MAVPVPPRTYRTIHVTFVAGRVRAQAFGAGAAPDFVLTRAGFAPLLSLQKLALTA